MKSSFFLGAILTCLLFFLACSGPSNPQKNDSSAGKIKVLSTTSMIEDLVKRVGGDHVESCVLIRGELDPHSYQLVKGDDEKLSSANLIFSNGLGLEHGPSLQRHLRANPKAIALGNKIQSQTPELILQYNGQIDPHIWMEISLWSKAVPFIIEALSQQDPEHAEEYQKNGTKLIEEMLRMDDQVRHTMLEIPPEKRFLVTSHDAFNYFAKAYLATEEEKIDGSWQKRFAAPEGLAPDSQLSATDIRNIIAHLKRYQIQVLFSESNLSKDSIRKIIHAGKEQGMNLHIATPYLYADAMGESGSDGDTYLKMIQHDAATIKKALMAHD